MVRIIILRMGHRFYRDSRVTTHVGLTGRALGADGVIVADRRDKEVEATIGKVTKRFGGQFDVQSGVPWKRAIHDWKSLGGRVVHLTVYGLPLPEILGEIREAKRDILVVVGSEKMPGEVFRLADWNVSVTNQPMSEVAALAIFLERFNEHGLLDQPFPGGEFRIVPSRDRKRIVPVVQRR